MKGKLNNLMIQLRKNCSHPDLLESAFDGSCICLDIFILILYRLARISFDLTYLILSDLYPPVEVMVEQCGKFQLLERLLLRLFARKHKV